MGDFYGVEDATHHNPVVLAQVQRPVTNEHIHERDTTPGEEHFDIFGTPAHSESDETPAGPQVSDEPAQGDNRGDAMGEPPVLPAPVTPHSPTLSAIISMEASRFLRRIN